MRAIDRVYSTTSNSGTVTTNVSTFELSGGTYAYSAAAGTWGAGGSVGIVVTQPTGTTSANIAITAGITANSFGTVVIPPGPGTITAIGTITNGSITLVRIPGE